MHHFADDQSECDFCFEPRLSLLESFQIRGETVSFLCYECFGLGAIGLGNLRNKKF